MGKREEEERAERELEASLGEREVEGVGEGVAIWTAERDEELEEDEERIGTNWMCPVLR